MSANVFHPAAVEQNELCKAIHCQAKEALEMIAVVG